MTIRKKTLAPGVDVFNDVGMTFYVVQRGDTLGGIRRKLIKLSEYKYLEDQPGKLESFNIPARELQAGMLIPIPYMTERQLYYPKNACKLFFAFMVEKILESGRSGSKAKGYLVKLFELGPEMATFYNGSGWRRTNPRYLPNIRRNYDASLEVLED